VLLVIDSVALVGMVSMQEYLLEKKIDKELPERQAELELQNANVRLSEERRDIEVIQKWHTSTIKQRMVEWQNMHLKADRECPYKGEVLFCDEKDEAQQDLVRIVDTREALVRAWYANVQGLTDVFFRENQKGTLRYMRFGFYSADVEEKVRFQCLKGRRDFDGNLRASLYIVRTHGHLPVNVLQIIKQFIPEYIEQLKHEKEHVETKAPRW